MAADSPGCVKEHGLRAGAGGYGDHSRNIRPDRATRFVETTKGILSYAKSAPLLADLIRDPYILEFTGLAEKAAYLERDLETLLLDHLQSFFLELGSGFCFEARQKRVTVGNEHDYIDIPTAFFHPGEDQDYISLTEIAKSRNAEHPRRSNPEFKEITQ